MNILITGSGGLLGSSMMDLFKSQGESVHGFNRESFSWDSHHRNIELLKGVDCIIHAAANTNVEECERDPSSCYRDNTLMTERLAYAASHAGCKFIYISSTGIYGEQKLTPYSEYDPIHPATHHHRAKWMAEQAVGNYCKDALILRTGWLFGGGATSPKNFVARRIEEAVASSGKKIYSNSEQRGVPTSTRDFSVKLSELMLRDEIGVFNLVNQGNASRYEYVKKIIELADLDVDVLPVAADSFNREAKVSPNEMAISLKFESLGYQPLPDWSESLEKYIKEELGTWLLGKKHAEQS